MTIDSDGIPGRPSGRDSDIGTDTSGIDPDIGSPSSRPDADDLGHKAFGEAAVRPDRSPVSREEAEKADTDELHGTPDDLKPGKRAAAGIDPDLGAGEPDITGVPGSTTGGG
jgi:hypothetical protein